MAAENSEDFIPLRKKRSAGLGCMAKLTFLAAATLGSGIYLLGKWETINGVTRAGSILLVLLGGLFCVPLLFLIAARIGAYYFQKKIIDPLAPTLQIGKDIVEQNKKAFVEEYEYRPAIDDDFAQRDRAWYDAATQELTSLGFVSFGDAVNKTVEESAGVLVIMRRFASADGATMAGLYQYVQGNKDFRVCDLESEVSDATFIATSNAEVAKAITMPPQIRSAKHATPITELVRLHDEAKAAVLAEKPGASFVEIRTLADLMASQAREQVIKAAFRKGIGYVDPEEVRRMADAKFPDDPAVSAIATASADIARKQQQMRDHDKDVE